MRWVPDSSSAEVAAITAGVLGFSTSQTIICNEPIELSLRRAGTCCHSIVQGPLSMVKGSVFRGPLPRHSPITRDCPPTVEEDSVPGELQAPTTRTPAIKITNRILFSLLFSFPPELIRDELPEYYRPPARYSITMTTDGQLRDKVSKTGE